MTFGDKNENGDTNIGRILREKRLAENKSLADIEAQTNIKKKYLRALEANKFSLLPGDVYARAFIMEYGETLGLNKNELAGNISKILPDVTSPYYLNKISKDQLANNMQLYKYKENHKRFNQSLVMVLVVSLVVVIFIIGLAFISMMNTHLSQPHSTNRLNDNNNVKVSGDFQSSHQNSEDKSTSKNVSPIKK